MRRWFYVELHCQDAGAPDLDTHLDLLMDALDAEPGEVDADVGAEPDTGRVEFCISIRAESPAKALARAQTYVRSALHGAGVATPGWERIAQLVDRGDAAATVRPSALPVSS